MDEHGVDWAMTTLARRAGQDLQEFLILDTGILPDEEDAVPEVTVEDVTEAGRIMAEAIGDPPEDPQGCAETVICQVLEGWWWSVGNKALTVPAKRARIIAYIEGRIGRPLDLEDPGEEAGLSPEERAHLRQLVAEGKLAL